MTNPTAVTANPQHIADLPLRGRPVGVYTVTELREVHRSVYDCTRCGRTSDWWGKAPTTPTGDLLCFACSFEARTTDRTRKCERCGDAYQYTHNHQRFCSARCRVAAHRAAKGGWSA